MKSLRKSILTEELCFEGEPLVFLKVEAGGADPDLGLTDPDLTDPGLTGLIGLGLPDPGLIIPDPDPGLTDPDPTGANKLFV